MSVLKPSSVLITLRLDPAPSGRMMHPVSDMSPESPRLLGRVPIEGDGRRSDFGSRSSRSSGSCANRRAVRQRRVSVVDTGSAVRHSTGGRLHTAAWTCPRHSGCRSLTTCRGRSKSRPFPTPNDLASSANGSNVSISYVTGRGSFLTTHGPSQRPPQWPDFTLPYGLDFDRPIHKSQQNAFVEV